MEKKPRLIGLKNLYAKLLTLISPTLNTKVMYRHKFGKWPDLKHPQSFNEKVSWLKLHTYRNNPLITQCADKLAVREFVQQQGCGDILNPIYGVWDKPEEIDFEALPDKFVLKCNYFCHMNLVVTDKTKMDIPATRKLLKRWLRSTDHMRRSEMHYAAIEKKIIAEKYIETADGLAPIDYKVYCSYGKPSYVMTCVGRSATRLPEFFFYDLDGRLQRDFSREGMAAPKNYRYTKPEGWDAMLDYARKLSAPFPFVRVDFYMEQGHVIFGELTFTPAAGMDTDLLPAAETNMGATIQLPTA
jgi:hypothetical protein